MWEQELVEHEREPGGSSLDRQQYSSGASASTGTSSCGPKPGVKATGSPIVLGAINTKQPGTDFTDQPNMEQAYFDCVNANGGVNGHVVKLIGLTDQTQPAQIAALAHQLIQTDHVVGLSGNSDILECTIDHSYWEKLGAFVIGAGIAPECYSTPNIADVNMGPRFSSDGAVQYGLDPAPLQDGRSCSQTCRAPATSPPGRPALAKAANVPIAALTENVPINDANSSRAGLVDKAGSNGSVVLNFTPPEALVILQAAQKLGLGKPRQGLGLLDAVQHRLPRYGAWSRSGTTSCSSTLSSRRPTSPTRRR